MTLAALPGGRGHRHLSSRIRQPHIATYPDRAGSGQQFGGRSIHRLRTIWTGVLCSVHGCRHRSLFPRRGEGLWSTRHTLGQLDHGHPDPASGHRRHRGSALCGSPGSAARLRRPRRDQVRDHRPGGASPSRSRNSQCAILAVSRGAGEVAPILFTGAAYFLPKLPTAPQDQFMHLGYHVYVLATQSPDVDATRPLLYSTVLVLLILTFALNATAIWVRSRMRRRFAGAH